MDEEIEILEVGQIEELPHGTTGVYRVETETAVYVINFDGNPMSVSRHPKEKHEINPYPVGTPRLEVKQLRKDRMFLTLLGYAKICLGEPMSLMVMSVGTLGDVGFTTYRNTTIVRNIRKIELGEDPQ